MVAWAYNSYACSGRRITVIGSEDDDGEVTLYHATSVGEFITPPMAKAVFDDTSTAGRGTALAIVATESVLTYVIAVSAMNPSGAKVVSDGQGVSADAKSVVCAAFDSNDVTLIRR